MWWTTGVAYDTEKVDGEADQLGRAVGREVRAAHRDARRHARGVRGRAVPARATTQHDRRRGARRGPRAAPGAEAAGAHLHDRRHRRPVVRRRLGRRTPGAPTSVPGRQGARRRSSSTSPRRAASAAPTRRSCSPAPSTRSRRSCSSTTCSTRKVSAKNTNYIGYMGPNAAAKEFIKPDILKDPAVNPDQAVVDSPRSSSWTSAPTWTSTPRRWTTLRCRCVAAWARARSVLPGIGWLRALLPRPAGDHLHRQPRDEGPVRRRCSFDRLTPRQLRERARPRRSCRRSGTRSATPALTTIFSIAIGYPIAYWISRYGGRNKTLLLILVMLPFWTSYLIRTYAWMIILRDNGVVNSVLVGARA